MDGWDQDTDKGKYTHVKLTFLLPGRCGDVVSEHLLAPAFLLLSWIAVVLRITKDKIGMNYKQLI